MPVTIGILQAHALDPIDRAIDTLRSDDRLRDQLTWVREALLDEIEPLSLLHLEASRLLAGDQLAARRFEALLERLAVDTEPETEAALGSVAQDANTPGSEASEPQDEPHDDAFVRLDNLLSVSVAVGYLPVDSARFLSLFGALTTTAGAIFELEELTGAALIFLQRGDPQPMRTLTWRAKPRPKRKAKPRAKSQPRRPRVRFKSKIKDTHSAWMSCFRAAAVRARSESLAAPRFSVTSVSPIDACPGQQITIRGTNFGFTGGSVAFRTPAGTADEYVAVTVDSWSDTTIVVTVPSWAREGRLLLSPFDHLFISCSRKWAVRRLPDPNGFQNDQFLGGLPEIFSLQVNGRDSRAWAAPDKEADVTWVTTSGAVKIEIRNDSDAAETHWTKTALAGGTGSIKWPTKPVTTATKYIITLKLTNRCATVTRDLVIFVTVPAVLEIVGVEITQGIQVFAITGGPRNTVPSVAFKDTIVRVYAASNRGGFMNDKLANFTAALTIDGQTLPPINQAPAGSSSGGNPYLDLGFPGAIFREQTDSSFNFRIPSALCVGTRSFNVDVWGTDEFGPSSKSQVVWWTWNKKPAWRLRYVRVSYMGGQPTPVEAMFTLERAVDLLPTPPLDLGPSWLDTWNTSQDLSPENEEGKEQLLAHLTDAHNCADWEFLGLEDDCPDDDGTMWLGVVSANVGGIADLGSNTGFGPVATEGRRRVTSGHEIGHMVCLRHVNQGCDGVNPDKSEPCGGGDEDYDGLVSGGQIFEVAFDPHYNKVVPSPRFDFMSYACNRWISEANWNRLYSIV